MGKVDHANTNAKRARMATLITDKVNFRAMKVTGDKGRHYTTIKVSIHKVDSSLNVHSTNNSFKTHETKACSTKRRNGKIQLIVGDFKTTVSVNVGKCSKRQSVIYRKFEQYVIQVTFLEHCLSACTLKQFQAKKAGLEGYQRIEAFQTSLTIMQYSQKSVTKT